MGSIGINPAFQSPRLGDSTASSGELRRGDIQLRYPRGLGPSELESDVSWIMRMSVDVSFQALDAEVDGGRL